MRACPRCGGYVHATGWHADEPYCLNCSWRDHGVESRPAVRRCEDCGEDISGRWWTARYCERCSAARKRASNALCDRRRRRPRRALSCEQCGVDIQDRYVSARFCDNCAAARRRASVWASSRAAAAKREARRLSLAAAR